MEPLGRVEVLRVGGNVATGSVPPAVAVSQVAAPAGLVDMVVEEGS
jgi:hypothetical protein